MRLLIVCACVAISACSKPSVIRGVVQFPQYGTIRPGDSVPVYALRARNDIDRDIFALCASDSLLAAVDGLEVPIGPVRVSGEGLELSAVSNDVANKRIERAAAKEPPPWIMRDAYAAYRSRLDSLLRREAIATVVTSETGAYQLTVQPRDSIELFAFSLIDVGGTLMIWRDRIAATGTHDLRTPVRRMHHVYCGEP